MTYRSLFFLTLFVVVSFKPALACSCLWRGDFVEYAEQTEGVIQARIVSYGDPLSHGEALYDSMIVEVVAVIKGNFKYKTLKLLGDPGHLCRDYVDSRAFAIGKEYLIAIHGDEAEQPFGGCGEAWLALNDGIAEGRKLTESGQQRYTIPMSELLTKLQRKTN